ncbi:Contactin-associated protein-like 2 [Ameca splendens]|uniref:Contactin-associated protein-like 2 n=1 Tax=Ameca splendens TaxID=208324 RepID=A0ABV0Z5L1_9TELE
MLTVDGDEASTVRTAIPAQIKTGGTYYFGGYFSHTNRRLLQRSFQGCIQMILIDDHLVDLQAVEEGRIGTFENVSLDMCAIIDRCVPNHCEHGGKCSQTWDTFSCNCSGTGYSGATCHTCFIILGDVRAAMPVELRMSNCGARYSSMWLLILAAMMPDRSFHVVKTVN